MEKEVPSTLIEPRRTALTWCAGCVKMTKKCSGWCAVTRRECAGTASWASRALPTAMGDEALTPSAAESVTAWLRKKKTAWSTSGEGMVTERLILGRRAGSTSRSMA